MVRVYLRNYRQREMNKTQVFDLPPLREAECRFRGVGRPAWMPGEPCWAKDGPSRRAHGAGPERGNLSEARAVRGGGGVLVTLPLLQSDTP